MKPANTSAASSFETEWDEKGARSSLLDALDNLVKNYERAQNEGSWAAMELACYLEDVRDALSLKKADVIRIVDRICTKAATMTHSSEPKISVNDALDILLAELPPFLPDVHKRLLYPAVMKELRAAVRTYANEPSDVERAEAVLQVVALFKPSWAAGTTAQDRRKAIDAVRKAIVRARKDTELK